MKKHIVLLGDSIFDNQVYVGITGTPLICYLNSFLDKESKATLMARDGSIMRNVYQQIVLLPKDTTHIVLSIGGNDIHHNILFLEEPASSVKEVLLRLNSMITEFEKKYVELLRHIKKLKKPLTVCTIYNCYFEDTDLQTSVETALSLFNDAIIRNALKLSIPVIDLRGVCTEPTDYVNNIEPSDSGGRKIAGAIYKFFTNENSI